MRIEQLQYLVAIFNTGSFSLAAEKLHISQPSISQSMSSLEQELGAKIFNRSRYGVEPTEVGKVIYKKSLEALGKLEEIKEEVNIQSSTISGQLSLAIVPSVCSTILPKTLAVFTRKFPLVQVEIIEKGSLEVMNDVLFGNVEIGIVSIPDGELLHQDKLQFKELLQTKVQVCVGKDFKVADGKSISPKEIIKHPLVMHKSSYNIRQFLVELLSGHGDLNILFTTDNTELAKKVIMEGVALGFFADLILRHDPYVRDGHLIPLDISGNEKYSNIGWLHSKNKIFSKGAQEFIKELEYQTMLEKG